MGFLAPWFLAGIAAIGLPVYLHLLRRHTNTPRPFSSLMFFERRTQSSIKHRRLRYLLLFSVRALLLLLLALAFANPFINRAAANITSDKLMLVVLDNSFSMRAGSRMADARSEALSVLSSRSGDEKAQVMALGSQLHVLTEPTVDPGSLRAAVESVKPGDSRGNFAELARAVRSLSDSVHTPIELHLISDMQKTAMPGSFSELGMPANVSLVLHPLVKSAVPNWTVESVNAPGQVFDTKKARTQIVVAGFDTPAATRTVSLVVAGKTIATKMVEVPANGRATVEFESLEVPYGFTRCEVRIDSADSFPADDVSIFAVERADPRRALFVHEGNDTKSLVYFRAALTSAAESAFVLEAVTPEQLSNVPYSKYAFVVLDDLLSLPASAESDLAKYVQSGGSILIAAGAATSHSNHIPVLGNKIMDARYYSRTGDRFLNVGDADATHPSIEKADRWAGVKFYFATVVDPGDDRIAARLTDQTPILLEKKIGEGTVLLFASGFDNLTNDFPLHSAFVPFVDQTSRYLSGTERRSGSRVVDSFLDLRNSKEQAVSVEVIDPEGQRPLSLKETSTAQSYQLIEAGFYELQLADGRHDLIGVNADRRESDLAVIPDNTLSLWKGSPGGVTQQTSGGGSSGTGTNQALQLVVVCHVVTFRGSSCGKRACRSILRDTAGGTMSTRDQLNSYISQLEQRLRLGAVIRGAAILTSVALVVTVILVVITNAFAFTSGSITIGRATLFFSLALAAVLGLALPIYALNRRRAAKMAEATFPQFQQRLVTFAERDADKRDPFLGLLAADTLEVARHAEPKRLIPDSQLATFLGAGAVSLGILVWMILAGPGYWGRGAAMLWAATPSDAGTAIYDLHVSPGDASVRRNADQIVTAQVIGLPTDAVHLYARYKSASKWDQVVMHPQEGGSGFQFVFAGLPEDVEYYVEAGPLHSRHFNLRVLDLPGVKNIRVTYRYPDWTHLQNVVEERGGDLRAVEGTQADLEVQTDRPLKDGLLVLDDDTQVHLTGGEGNIYKGTVPIAKDGEYHMAALDQGQPVRLSNDYFIEADKAIPPNIEIAQPSRDYRASPIEEVKVAVKADDQFGVDGMTLHYSVNGGPDQTVDLLKQKGAKQADGSMVLSLENFKMVPGDVVSLYATAKDARAESRTDIFFVQADPFEREFSQSQQGGGGGGGGGGGQADQTDISQREKEIIGETWKQHGDTTATKQESAEAAKFLSGVQAKLGEQAKSLAGRMQSRELSEENDDFNNFVKDMNAAADAMGPASGKLQQQKWQDAMSDEQKALQHLLRAEATFRQIQVAFGSRGGGGGGGGAGRDLASLFDLELDTEKNQYETGQTASSQSQKDKDIDEALQKLDDLARRQEELAQQTRNGQTSEQRWQQEMLRREAEELQKQMEQMQRNGQQQGDSSSASSSGQQGSSGQSGSSGKQGSSSDPRVQQSLDQLKQATDDMRRANSPQSEADARRAADRLKEASGLLGGMRNQQTAGKLNQIGDEADRMAEQQKKQEDQAKQSFGSEGQRPDREQLSAMADDRQKLAEDLGGLEKEMQDTVKDLAGNNQRAASSKLRDALGDMQSSDLRSRIQRGADWTRRGVNPNYNGAEPDVTAGMQRLSKEIHDAQQAMTNDQQQAGNSQQGLETALDRMERLRSQMDSLTRGPEQGRQQGQQGQGQQGQGQPGQGGQQQGQAGQQGGGNQAGARQGGGNGYGGVDDRGDVGAFRGGNGGRFYGGFDTGNNTPSGGPAVQPDTSPVPRQQAYQQSMRDLNDLRPAVQQDPQMEAELQDLIRQMQKLDPSRFPGNPALVEQLHTQVLASVDKLELELQRQLDDKQGGQVRSGDTRPVPPGYEESVADYYRRLSKNSK